MRHDIDLAISKPLWWTQNRRSRSWAVPYRRKKLVKTMSLLTFRNLINGGKLQKPEHWPVHVTAIIHPLTHGRFDPENAAPMVKAILDGITQSGYWPDDNAKYVVGPDYRLGEPSTEKASTTSPSESKRRNTSYGYECNRERQGAQRDHRLGEKSLS